MLKQNRQAKVVFTGYEFMPWYKWDMKRAARGLELEGVLSQEDAVVDQALSRLDSQDTRKLLLLISPAAHFHTDLLEEIADEADFSPSDKFFYFENACWDLRNAGIARWGVAGNNYSVRPLLRPLLAQRFKQESPELELYNRVTELMAQTAR